MRKLVLVSVIFGSLLAASSAQAAIPSALGVTCNIAADGVRECGTGSSLNDTVRSTAPTWDGTPIDVNIAFPPAPASGPDGSYPVIIYGHGYGGEKLDFGASGSTAGMRQFTSRGYAVFSMTDRGFHQSCGKDNAITAAAGACDAAGWIHLMDDRFEVRDAQFLTGRLADQGLIDGQKIGATGGSYGGGLSMALASLKDRVMLPNGQLVPWTSSTNIPMRIAAATPIVPWTDLSYSLDPNGGTLDYVADAPYSGRIGIEKESLVGGLYFSGSSTGKYCGASPYPPCTDFDSDVTAWNARLDAGEPYDGDPEVNAIFGEISAHHSSYYIDHSEQPAPLLIANGFTDDLFPADEAIRYYNKIRSLYPGAPISLFFGDFGHPRAAPNKTAENKALTDDINAWFDFYVKGTGSTPFQGATAYTMTCPTTVPSGGPSQAGSWAGLEKGEVRLHSAPSQTIAPDGGSSAVDTAFDPVSSGQNPCHTAPAADLPGVATYRLPAASGSGFTLMGSPTVVANIGSPTANSEVAARLLDVDPAGTETLVDRQLLRPAIGTARQVFQLHPTGHLFASGHVAKLELLPSDSHGSLPVGGYGRAANGQGQVTVSGLSLRLPTLDGPGAAAGQVKAASVLPLPCGMAIAPEFSSFPYLHASLGDGKLKFKGRKGKVPIDSAPGPNACLVQVRLLGSGKKKKKKALSAGKHKKKKKAKFLGKGGATIPGGQSATVRLKLSKHGRTAVRRGRGIRVRVTTVDATGNTVQTAKVHFKKKKHKHKGKHKR